MAALRIRSDLASGDLRRLARGESDGRVCRRLLAIAMALDGVSREAAARRTGMERQTPRDRIGRYNAEAVEGLRDRARSGRPPLLAAALARAAPSLPLRRAESVLLHVRLPHLQLAAQQGQRSGIVQARLEGDGHFGQRVGPAVRIGALRRLDRTEAGTDQIQILVGDDMADRADLAGIAIALPQFARGGEAAAVTELRELHRHQGEAVEIGGDGARQRAALQPHAQPGVAAVEAVALRLPALEADDHRAIIRNRLPVGDEAPGVLADAPILNQRHRFSP
ncbi:transposase [Azospirillum sp. B510]|nr:transposase [Azospirillum sp. B510]